MGDHQLVSVIIPVHKVEPYLCECIDSILAQTYTNLEIILVDDGSPDRCPIICDEYAAMDGRIQVIHKKNGGISDARNQGIDAATGKWIVFVDSDDMVSSNMIEALVNAGCDENTAVAVGFSRFSSSKPSGAISRGGKVFASDIQQYVRMRKGMFAWGVLYNREIVERIGLRFDCNLENLEDVAWNSMYFGHVGKLCYIPENLYYYRQNPASVTSRCVDKHWQVQSWFEARYSIFKWFSGNPSSPGLANILRFTFHYCANNIFAECAVGKLTYSDYSALRRSPPSGGMLIPELLFESMCPRLYFYVYMTMMQLRNYFRY